MTALETMIAEAVAGGLRGLTLWPTDKGWQGNATNDGVGWRIEFAADPVEALKKAIGAKQEQPTDGGVFD